MVLRGSTLESLRPSGNARVDISLTGQIKLNAKTTRLSWTSSPHQQMMPDGWFVDRKPLFHYIVVPYKLTIVFQFCNAINFCYVTLSHRTYDSVNFFTGDILPVHTKNFPLLFRWRKCWEKIKKNHLNFALWSVSFFLDDLFFFLWWRFARRWHNFLEKEYSIANSFILKNRPKVIENYFLGRVSPYLCLLATILRGLWNDVTS